MSKRWIPRASSFGAYVLCDYRAALDRAIAEGAIPTPVVQSGAKPYADLGSCIHARLQDILGCDTPRPSIIEPEHLASAATLFGGNAESALNAVEAAARFAALVMPKTPDGKPWRSEYAYRHKTRLTGHIDFVSQDGTVIVDLKTTARKPDHNRMKAEHAVQLMAYQLMVPTATRGYILYVDSLKANWALLTDPLDFTSSDTQDQLRNLDEYAKRLRSKGLYKTCLPRIGTHCQSTFCPYTAVCRDKIIPPATQPVDATAIIAPTQTSPL